MSEEYDSNNSSGIFNTSADYSLNTSADYTFGDGEKLTEEDISNISLFYDEMRLGDYSDMASMMKYELVMQRWHLSKLPKVFLY